jgi:hypothetical protein
LRVVHFQNEIKKIKGDYTECAASWKFGLRLRLRPRLRLRLRLRLRPISSNFSEKRSTAHHRTPLDKYGHDLNKDHSLDSSRYLRVRCR